MPKPEDLLVNLISLKGKRALITGSASGIGKAIADRFAEAGADLILVDIDDKNLIKTAGDLKVWKVNVIPKKVDLSKKREIDQLWKDIEGFEPDILVNNAGIYPFRDFLEVDEAFYHKVHAINLEAVLWMCQQMIRAKEKQGGVIINVSSIEAVLPFKKSMVHYDASKAGVIGLTRGLAKDFSDKGFRINALIPGGIATPGTKGAAMEFLKGNFGLAKTGYDFMSRLPMGRWGNPDEVAKAAIFLASDLSSYITGVFLAVDGGFLSA
ncbi:MAG: SDR family NAD(P)-dependent oxidoreductase [Candidatus Bathyarchaeota archaeon]|nr:SDR family NAD(P)-dependent oxidoreductase [Candidatus Bathyarchaeota archaeon]